MDREQNQITGLPDVEKGGPKRFDFIDWKNRLFEISKDKGTGFVVIGCTYVPDAFAIAPVAVLDLQKTPITDEGSLQVAQVCSLLGENGSNPQFYSDHDEIGGRITRPLTIEQLPDLSNQGIFEYLDQPVIVDKPDVAALFWSSEAISLVEYFQSFSRSNVTELSNSPEQIVSVSIGRGTLYIAQVQELKTYKEFFVTMFADNLPSAIQAYKEEENEQKKSELIEKIEKVSNILYAYFLTKDDKVNNFKPLLYWLHILAISKKQSIDDVCKNAWDRNVISDDLKTTAFYDFANFVTLVKKVFD